MSPFISEMINFESSEEENSQAILETTEDVFFTCRYR